MSKIQGGTNQNMQELLDKLFSPNKVLLCYRCGSSIFGLSEDESDKDFTVVIDGYDSCNVVKPMTVTSLLTVEAISKE